MIGDIPAWKPWTQDKVIEKAENVPNPVICIMLPYMVCNYLVPGVKQSAASSVLIIKSGISIKKIKKKTF